MTIVLSMETNQRILRLIGYNHQRGIAASLIAPKSGPLALKED
jgi:hypothetical protein